MAVLRPRGHQPPVRGHHVVLRFHHRIVLCVSKPDRDFLQMPDILLGNPLVQHRLADREGGCKEIRIAHQHPHGHKAAVGIPADIHPVRINHSREPRDEFINQGLQCRGILGFSGIPVFSAPVVQPHRVALGHQDKRAPEFRLHPVFGQLGYLVAAPGDGQILPAFSGTVQEDDQGFFSVQAFRDEISVPEGQVRMAGDAGQETCRLWIEFSGRHIEHQPVHRVVPLAEGRGQGNPVIPDRVGFMSVDVLKISRQRGAAFPDGSVRHFKRHKAALSGDGVAVQVGGIRCCHRPVSPAGNKLIPFDEALRQLHDPPVLPQNLHIYGEGLRLQFLRRGFPGHAKHQFRHIRPEIRHLDDLIIQISHLSHPFFCPKEVRRATGKPSVLFHLNSF